MRRLVVAVTVVLAALVLFGARSIVTASAGGGDDFTLTEKTGDEQFIDLGDKGESLGDRFVANNKLYDEDGDKVGTDYVDCVLVSKDSAQCTATATLEGGDIAAQGLGSEPPFTVSIVGGTGKYRGATGEIDISQVDQKTSKLKVHLDD